MRGIVVCPEPRAAEIGARILRRGGNAIDAAVATAFVQAVEHPTMCGVGGGGTMNLYLGPAKRYLIIDFHPRAGSKVRPDMWKDQIVRMSADTYCIKGHRNLIGHTSVMTPGTVLGLYEAWQGYGSGKLSWRELIEPAIPYAENGIPLTEKLALWYIKPPVDEGFPRGVEILRATKACERLWFKESGSSYEIGEVRKNQDYAQTLKKIAEHGANIFYRGELADSAVRDFEANGGFLTREDFERYSTRTYEPIRGNYRGFELTLNRPPGGGIVLMELLNILEGYELSKMDPSSTRYNWLLTQAMRAATSDRVQFVGDQNFVQVPVATLISKEHAAGWRRRIDSGEKISIPRAKPISLAESTTHICVADEKGNVVSVTHSNGSFSGCVTEGMGFVWNNFMILTNPMPEYPNSIHPGKARTTGMTPTILLKEGKPVWAIGALGGFGIISGVAQTIINLIDHKLSPLEAVYAPRMHCEGGLIQLEGRMKEEVAEDLKKKGNPVKFMAGGWEGWTGVVQVISLDPQSGTWRGASDPRGNAGIFESKD